MLKSDLHIHTKEDPKDRWIGYSAKDIIDEAYKQKFDVLSITEHNSVYYNAEIVNYAKSKGILLIPGTEKLVEGKHVLFYNFNKDDLNKIKRLSDIQKYKKENNLVIAPHPYFRAKVCLEDLVYKYKDSFDAIEFAFFYTKWVNFNKKALEMSKSLKKPLIGNSDLHYFENFGTNFTIIDSKKDISSIIRAIKQGKVQLGTKPLSLLKFARCLTKTIIKDTYIKVTGKESHLKYL